MVAILEFTVNAEEFLLGGTLEQASDVELIELERVIPLGDQSIPFLWVTTDDFETFERSIRSQSAVASIDQFGVIDRHGLYRIEWDIDPPNQLIDGLVEANATLLEAHHGERWLFRIRFPAHELLTQFYTYCTDHGIQIHVERVVPLTQRPRRGPVFDFSPEQREALVLAIDRGYFETPREVTLDDLAADLEISQQALSDRIRRGVQQVLVDSLSALEDE